MIIFIHASSICSTNLPIIDHDGGNGGNSNESLQLPADSQLLFDHLAQFSVDERNVINEYGDDTLPISLLHATINACSEAKHRVTILTTLRDAYGVDLYRAAYFVDSDTIFEHLCYSRRSESMASVDVMKVIATRGPTNTGDHRSSHGGGVSSHVGYVDAS